MALEDRRGPPRRPPPRPRADRTEPTQARPPPGKSRRKSSVVGSSASLAMPGMQLDEVGDLERRVDLGLGEDRPAEVLARRQLRGGCDPVRSMNRKASGSSSARTRPRVAPKSSLADGHVMQADVVERAGPGERAHGAGGRRRATSRTRTTAAVRGLGHERQTAAQHDAGRALRRHEQARQVGQRGPGEPRVDDRARAGPHDRAVGQHGLDAGDPLAHRAAGASTGC